MNWTKRDLLMQQLPAAADILALIPTGGTQGSTAVYIQADEELMLGAATEIILSCLAGREDEELRLIRRSAGRMLARRRNIVLPILHGCVLAPVMVRPVRAGQRGTLGYINIARKALILDDPHTGTNIVLQNGAVIHSLWHTATVKKLVQEARALHYKLLIDVRRQLESAAAYA